jgi:para-nitrobenzyl esterase
MVTTSTTSGSVRGADGNDAVVFRGIPFAAPPTGPRRFAPPAPVEPWDGVRDCTEFGPVCPQMQPVGDAVADEDCLSLNVWTPAVDDARRPTLVWLHGGGYAAGRGSSPDSDGAAFARDGAVLVSLNYRLGALGFLYLDELFDGSADTGNLGLLDQIAALEWVRDNIAAFGGDPQNVTVFGNSAGAMSAATLLATDRAAGLFSRAILQSGAGHNTITAERATETAVNVLRALDVEHGDWDALRALPTEGVIAAATIAGGAMVPEYLREVRPLFGFGPVEDGRLLAARPVDCIATSAAAAGVDLLIGTNADEWTLVMFGMPGGGGMPDPAPSDYFRATAHSVDEVLAIYAKGTPRDDLRAVLAAIEGDHSFTVPAIRFADAHAARGEQVWRYRFSWPTPLMDGVLGACHTAEVPFVFDTLASGAFVGEAPPVDLVIAMHGAWVRFATSGDPNGGDLPAWPRYDPNERPTMDFGARRQLRLDPDGERLAVWDGVV